MYVESLQQRISISALKPSLLEYRSAGKSTSLIFFLLTQQQTEIALTAAAFLISAFKLASAATRSASEAGDTLSAVSSALGAQANLRVALNCPLLVVSGRHSCCLLANGAEPWCCQETAAAAAGSDLQRNKCSTQSFKFILEMSVYLTKVEAKAMMSRKLLLQQIGC